MENERNGSWCEANHIIHETWWNVMDEHVRMSSVMCWCNKVTYVYWWCLSDAMQHLVMSRGCSSGGGRYYIAVSITKLLVWDFYSFDTTEQTCFFFSGGGVFCFVFCFIFCLFLFFFPLLICWEETEIRNHLMTSIAALHLVMLQSVYTLFLCFYVFIFCLFVYT